MPVGVGVVVGGGGVRGREHTGPERQHTAQGQESALAAQGTGVGECLGDCFELLLITPGIRVQFLRLLHVTRAGQGWMRARAGRGAEQDEGRVVRGMLGWGWGGGMGVGWGGVGWEGVELSKTRCGGVGRG